MREMSVAEQRYQAVLGAIAESETLTDGSPFRGDAQDR
jgi:hypothetical protein